MPTLARIRQEVAKTPLRHAVMFAKHLGLTENDIFLASYPRSGSNWLKFLMLCTILERDIGFNESDELMHYIGDHWNAPELLPNGGRIVKTHQRFRPDYKRTIYIMRDLRGVIPSEYRYLAAQGIVDEDFDQFFDNFMTGEISGLGFWGDHVRSWLDAAANQADHDVLLVRFENLRNDGINELRRVMDFVGVEASDELLQAAFDYNTIDRMRAKEDAVADTTLSYVSKGNYRFVNKGATDGWKKQLSDAQQARVLEQAGPLLRELGYLRDDAPVSEGA